MFPSSYSSTYTNGVKPPRPHCTPVPSNKDLNAKFYYHITTNQLFDRDHGSLQISVLHHGSEVDTGISQTETIQDLHLPIHHHCYGVHIRNQIYSRSIAFAVPYAVFAAFRSTSLCFLSFLAFFNSLNAIKRLSSDFFFSSLICSKLHRRAEFSTS